MIFFDDFNTAESYHEALAPNATSKVYRINSVTDLYVETKVFTWTVNGLVMLAAYTEDLNPGGYFGIDMKYERNTQFDDVRITIQK